MKVGAKVTVFNFAMRNRRAELGLSQKRLAEMCGMQIYEISAIEGLRAPSGRAEVVSVMLTKIAKSLETDFSVLFPQDYLDMLQAELLPRRRQPYIWCRDIRLSELAASDIQLQLPSAEEIAFEGIVDQSMKQDVEKVLGALSPREREVVEMRFGMGSHKQDHTLEEVAQHFRVTRERVRQIEQIALKTMRSPKYSEALKDYPYTVAGTVTPAEGVARGMTIR
jgi:RNA polymerase sigma factor (sigma-70 family)